MRRNPKLAGFFVILFAALFLSLAGRDLRRDWEFDQTPERSSATIDRTWTTYGNKGSVHYHAAYHYTVNGISYQATDVSITASTDAQLSNGQQVPIRYLPLDLTATRIDWDTERSGHEGNDERGVAIGVGLAIIGLLVVIFAKRPDY